MREIIRGTLDPTDQLTDIRTACTIAGGVNHPYVVRTTDGYTLWVVADSGRKILSTPTR